MALGGGGYTEIGVEGRGGSGMLVGDDRWSAREEGVGLGLYGKNVIFEVLQNCPHQSCT